MKYKKAIYCLFILATCLQGSVNAKYSYEQEALLVKRQMDSLALKFGESTREQSKIFIQSITNYSFELFNGNLLDRNDTFESYLNTVAKKLNPNFKKGVYDLQISFCKCFHYF